MAVVSYLSKDQAAEKVRPDLRGSGRRLGAVPNVFRAMAHNPEMLEGFLALNAALRKTKLDGKLRELAYIKTSELNGCDYCLHHHRQLGEEGRPHRAADRRDRPSSRPATPTTTSSATCFAVRRGGDPAHQRQRRADRPAPKPQLSDREIVELAMTVGIANFTNRVTETLRIELP